MPRNEFQHDNNESFSRALIVYIKYYKVSMLALFAMVMLMVMAAAAVVRVVAI